MSESGEIRLRGIADTLGEAHRVREIAASSPLVTVSLHRLLLAILSRVFSPRDNADWLALWCEGRWDRTTVESYLDRFRARFDLFSPATPFMQDLAAADRPPAAPARLMHERATGCTYTFFDHNTDKTSLPLAAAEAACYLLSYRNFALGGVIGTAQGVCGVRDAPLVGKALFMGVGTNLFETLALNLLPRCMQPGEARETIAPADLPEWEKPSEPLRLHQRIPCGYLDFLTWQSRAVLLLPERAPNGTLWVPQVCIAAGCDLHPDARPWDPMIAWGPWRDNSLPRPLGLDGRGQWWQDCRLLLQCLGGRRPRPPVMDWIARLATLGSIEPGRFYGLAVTGMQSRYGRIAGWLHHRQPIPPAYLQDDDLAADLALALQIAEQAAGVLGKTIRIFSGGRCVTQHGDILPQPADGTGQTVMAYFWSEIQRSFGGFIGLLADYREARDELLHRWAKTVEQAVWRCFDYGVGKSPAQVRSLRARIEARDALAAMLYGRVLKPFRKEVRSSEAV